MPTTLSDLAKKSGLDISTISRALRDDPRVKPVTRERIQKLALEIGYQPNITARNLAAGSTKTVWLILPSLPFQIELELAQYAGPLMREQGYDLLIALYHNKEEVFTHLLKRLNQGVADGAIIMPNLDSITPELKQLININFPMVFIDRYIKKSPIHVVTTDQINCSAQLVQYCIDKKVDSFIVYFSNENDVERKRCKGAIDAIEKNNLPYTTANKLKDINLKSLKKYRRIGIVCNSPHFIRNIIKEYPDFFHNKALIFSCYDTWPGDPFPAECAYICHQDFPKMANVAVKEILKQVKSKSLPKKRKTFKIQANHFEEIKSTIKK
jgi:hypothetical protein